MLAMELKEETEIFCPVCERMISINVKMQIIPKHCTENGKKCAGSGKGIDLSETNENNPIARLNNILVYVGSPEEIKTEA